jgi:hypothetical protein
MFDHVGRNVKDYAGYYAGFVLFPDANNVEAACHRPAGEQ